MAGVKGGLKFFQTPEDLRNKPIAELPLLHSPEERPPSIVFALDQGPQSFPTTFFMGYKMKPNTFCHFDPSHRLWNDVKDGLAEGGRWGFISLATIVFNLDFGPFEGSEFFHRGRDALKHFHTNTTVQNPLLTRF